MLHVDIYIPAIAKSFEFSLDEHTRISMLIEEIAYIVSQKEQKKWEGSIRDLILCNLSKQCILPLERTLYQCKVRPGSQLVLL